MFCNCAANDNRSLERDCLRYDVTLTYDRHAVDKSVVPLKAYARRFEKYVEVHNVTVEHYIQ